MSAKVKDLQAGDKTCIIVRIRDKVCGSLAQVWPKLRIQQMWLPLSLSLIRGQSRDQEAESPEGQPGNPWERLGCESLVKTGWGLLPLEEQPTKVGSLS